MQVTRQAAMTQCANHVASSDRSPKQAAFLRRVPVHCITAFLLGRARFTAQPLPYLVESESHAWRIVSAIKICDSFERSAVKIHGRVFVSCSRVKACNFSTLLTFCSETFLEKPSPLNALRNYGVDEENYVV